MAKTSKKVNLKDILKNDVKTDLANYFTSKSVKVIDAGNYEGFTKDTLIVEIGDMHVQVKLITPSQKVGNKYELEEVGD